ncbi:2396_t:CDS:2 [Funneliformis caledonium]|uniref:2396_t:CDS:1 n=1 Tax=Funneliformis caledonium TaxID=1117310 RepID=A0A9N9I774_9GLOM|nr:2396_t:CDS:2 [Funneliformis caledonium]
MTKQKFELKPSDENEALNNETTLAKKALVRKIRTRKANLNFLLSDIETASPTTFVLSDDETMDQNQQDNSSVVLLPNNNHTLTALYSTKSLMILHSLGEMRSTQDYEET